jgi:poly(glycerol-phosphate) alpha-glucosyltransferase
VKVITLLESVSRADGGIFEAECALQRQLSLSQGVKIDVVGMEDPFTAQDAARWLPLKPKALRIKGPGALGYSPDLLAALDPKADLLYAATLWKYPSWAALKWAERTGKPMMVAPHGSIDPWALANAAWKKRIAAALFKDRQLHKAACLRALCQSEADAFRAYGLRNPIAIIPNGVDLPDFTESRVEGRGTRAEGEDGGRKTLLFLGRIHPKKGLPNLIRAFAQSRKSRVAVTDAKQRPGLQSREPWRLMIAGWDQGGHEAELIQLCGELELRVEGRGSRDESQRNKAEVEGGNIQWNTALDTDVIFTGPAFKEEKDALLRSADAFVLPSFSEGLPMSVLEAWAYGLPIVMTPECNLPEGYAAEAAIRIETDAPSIAAGLNALFSMKDVDLRAMGGRGYELVKQRFTWRTVAAQMRSVYDWMLGGGTPPECVRMD